MNRGQLVTQMRSHSGEWKWIVTRGKVFERDEFGAPLRMLGVHKDISDRKLAEESLRQSEAREHEKTTQLELALEELKRTQTKLHTSRRNVKSEADASSSGTQN